MQEKTDKDDDDDDNYEGKPEEKNTRKHDRE